MTAHGTGWTNLDFRPAAPGWRLAYLTDSTLGYFTLAIPGWLVQVETHDPRPLAERPRRVVAAICGGMGVVEPIDSEERNNPWCDFWCVLEPIDPDPTAEEATAEHASRLHQYRAATS